MKSFVILGLFILFSFVANAKNENSFVEGIFQCTVEEKLYLDNDKNGCIGDSTIKIACHTSGRIGPFVPKVLVIPSYIIHNGYKYKVRSIAPYAFAQCGDIEQLIVNEGVENIYEGAFYRCIRLNSVSLPSTIVDFSPSAFDGCSSLDEIKVDKKNPLFDSRENCNAIIDTEKNELILGCHTTTIPHGIKRISGAAFVGCPQLEQIAIPEGIIEIGNGAFRDCI